MAETRIALDAMGGDQGASVVVPAAILALLRHPDLHLILVGDQDVLKRRLQKHKVDNHERLHIHHASEVVGMDESPAIALRTKKDSSMRVAINLVKQGDAQACVSAGNTGALLATARFVLKRLPGIDRPAIIRTLPTIKPNRNVRVVDLGANVDSSPEHLLQFAVMGSVLAAAVDNIENPRVALLNIGEEAIKGNDLVKKTAELLSATSAVNYTGYVEGDKIYSNIVDVVVCDGFVGNIALKVMEGAARLIMNFVRQAFERNFLTKLAGLAAISVFKSLRNKIDPDRYNGASLIGLHGTVIKSHGGANKSSFANAIDVAIKEVEKNVPFRISSQVSELLQEA